MADDLDLIFARARQFTPEDGAAAERVLVTLRSRRQRSVLRAWTAGLLATAAMLGGVLYVQRGADLPTSAAYDVYSELSGEGW